MQRRPDVVQGHLHVLPVRILDSLIYTLVTHHPFSAWFLEITGKDNGTKYSDFIKAQADAVLKNAAQDGDKYTNLWYGADEGAAKHSSQSQGSALGALLAASKQSC